jgi:aspartate/methionine/tyrosine aminotransferase
MERALAARVGQFRPQARHDDRPDGAIDLTKPEPCPVAEETRAAATGALDQGLTHYTSALGLPSVRATIAAYLTARGHPVSPEQVAFTSGGREATYLALQASVVPGDRVLLTGPISPRIVEMVQLIGAEPVRLVTSPDNRFAPSAKEVAASLPARVLLLGNPNPATGTLMPQEGFLTLLDTALEHGLTTILDRSLADVTYDPPAPVPSPDLSQRLVLVGSLTESHGLAGWRAGYLSAPEPLMAKIDDMKSGLSICSPPVSQVVAQAALELPAAWLQQRVSDFRARRDRVLAELSGAGIRAIVPDALPWLLVDTRTLGDAGQLALQLARETGVIVEPATHFGASSAGLLRIHLGAAPGDLDTGVRRLTSFLTARGTAA